MCYISELLCWVIKDKESKKHIRFLTEILLIIIFLAYSSLQKLTKLLKLKNCLEMFEMSLPGIFVTR